MSGPSTASVLARGLGWSAAYQVFVTGLNFASMLVLVRILSPAEYGRAGAVAGLLGLLTVAKGTLFVEQALQEPEGVEPDWSAHWSAAMYLHMALFVVCEGAASLLWSLPDYRPLAPLLHLAGLGLLLEPAASLRETMLRRQMDFARLRSVAAIASIGATLLTLTLALLGAGAVAIVAGNNVALAVPFAVDLLLVIRFRPQRGFWAPPRLDAYRPALHFGLQRLGAGILSALRGGAEALVIPGVLGFSALGLQSRALSLFGQSVGRVLTLVSETAYPLLPTQAGDPPRFGARASLFARGLLAVAIPGALFLGWQGPSVSRVLYGLKWVEADPLLWPAAIFGLGGALFGVGASILMAVNRLRANFGLHATVTLLSLSALLIPLRGGELREYAWSVAAAQLVTGALALAISLPHQGPGRRTSVLPGCVAAASGALLLWPAAILAAELPVVPALLVKSVAFGLGALLGLRLAFPALLRALTVWKTP